VFAAVGDAFDPAFYGELHPFGTIPALVEGVVAEWETVDVFTLEDGRIKRLTTWYDMGAVVAMLRTPGSPAASSAPCTRSITAWGT
jgi:hypothetical protein